MDNQLNVTFTRMDQDLVSELDRQITERMDEDLDSDVLEKFQYLVVSHDVAWDQLEEWNSVIEQQQRELSRLQVERDKAIAGLQWYEMASDLDLADDGGQNARLLLRELGVPHDPLD